MKPPIAPEDVDGISAPNPHPAVVAVELDGEVVIYHEEAATVHVLNPTATIVWRCLDGSSGLNEICDDLAAVFEVDVERLRRDVIAVVRAFGRQGLLEGVEPDAQVVAAHAVVQTDGARTDDA